MAEEESDTVVVTGSGGFEKTVEKIEDEFEPSPREKYKSAIMQLISDIQANAPYLAFVSFCIDCANVPIHFKLLAGATCKVTSSLSESPTKHMLQVISALFLVSTREAWI